MVRTETGVDALEPESLAPLADAAVCALLREGEAANTLASYRAALRYWAAWFALRYRQPLTLPVAEATVLQFIVDHIQRTTDGCLVHELPDPIDQVLVSQGFKGKLGPLALSTVGHRLAVLSKLHARHAAPNPSRRRGAATHRQDPVRLCEARGAHRPQGGVDPRAKALSRISPVLLARSSPD